MGARKTWKKNDSFNTMWWGSSCLKITEAIKLNGIESIRKAGPYKVQIPICGQIVFVKVWANDPNAE